MDKLESINIKHHLSFIRFCEQKSFVKIWYKTEAAPPGFLFGGTHYRVGLVRGSRVGAPLPDAGELSKSCKTFKEIAKMHYFRLFLKYLKTKREIFASLDQNTIVREIVSENFDSFR